MPFFNTDDARIYYEDTGTGTETIFFAHGLLWSTQMYEHQVAFFKNRYRCVAMDFRGQGLSEVTASGYDMDTLTEDIAALIHFLGLKNVHFVGLSMGGFTGMRLALKYPELVKSLTLLNTSADLDDPKTTRKNKLLVFLLRLFGIGPVAGETLKIMFGKQFRTSPETSHEFDEMRNRLFTNNRTGIYRAVKGVLERKSVLSKIGAIDKPTLVICGDDDAALPMKHAEHIHQAISGSQFHILPGCGHTSTVEFPDEINRLINDFLQPIVAR